MHDGTGEVIAYLDKPLARFLKEIDDKDTTVLMFSDHGFHLGGLRKDIVNMISN